LFVYHGLTVKRIWYLDALAVLASLMVISLHILPSRNWGDWNELYWLIVRLAVPYFLFKAGALNIGRNDAEKSLRRAKKLGILSVVWTVLIASWVFILFGENVFLESFLRLIRFSSIEHVWYLPALMLLFLLTPIIDRSIRYLKEHTEHWFLIFMCTSLAILIFSFFADVHGNLRNVSLYLLGWGVVSHLPEPKHESKRLEMIGKHLFGVYLLHMFFVLTWNARFQEYMPVENIPHLIINIILSIMIFIISYVITGFLLKTKLKYFVTV
jgi:Uncharacterized protein conserved in bacteria